MKHYQEMIFMCRQSTVRLWFRYSWHAWVINLLSQIPASRSVTSIGSERNDTICALCRFPELFIDQTRCTVFTGRAGLSGGANRDMWASRGWQEKVTAGEEDGETGVVYVSSPHSSSFRHTHLYTKDKALPFAPLPLLSTINKSHSRVVTTAPPVCWVCLLRPVVWISVFCAQAVQGTESNATVWDGCQRDSSSPQQHNICSSVIRPSQYDSVQLVRRTNKTWLPLQSLRHLFLVIYFHLRASYLFTCHCHAV